MKKISSFFFCLLTSYVFAQSAAPAVYSCPSIIICDADNDLSSCHPSDKGVYPFDRYMAEGEIHTNMYTFIQANTMDDGYSECVYRATTGFAGRLSVSSKAEQLYPYTISPNNWTSGGYDGHNVNSCESPTATAYCRFSTQPPQPPHR